MKKRLSYALAAVALLGGATACSSAAQPGPSPASGSSTAVPSVTASSRPSATHGSGVTAVLSTPPCYAPLPASWARAYREGELWSRVPDGRITGAPLPTGGGVLYYRDVGKVAQFSIIGAGHRVIQHIGDVPNPHGQGQMTYDQIDADYGEFVYAPLNGQAASFNWRIYLWNRHTGAFRMIASNPTDAHGNPLPGGWVQPILTAKYLTWIQAIPRTNSITGSELVQYDLATGATRVLYRGLVTAFVPYHGSVLYSAVNADADPTSSGPAPMHLAAVSAATGASVTPPSGLTFAADSPNTIRADGNLIVWATDNIIRGWDPSWGHSITLVPSTTPDNWPAGKKLGVGPPNYPRLYGHFLAWYSGGTYVLDLTNGAFTRLDNAADGLDMSGPWLATWRYSAGTTYNRTTNIGIYDQYLLNMSTLPDLPSCKNYGSTPSTIK